MLFYTHNYLFWSQKYIIFLNFAFQNQKTTPMPSLKTRVMSTMKSSDTEGAFELYFTRTPGYLWALFFKQLGVHPIAVTLMSIVIGCAAGIFFASPDLKMNLVGMLLLLWANWYDCADGQLARMTNKRTLIGRILDGFAGDMWFFCIYLGISIRLTPQCGIWIWLLCLWAGAYCHARQCSLADYYRNAHLFFIGATSELERSQDILARYHQLGWNRKEWFEKLYLFFYHRYTRSQESPTPCLQRLLHSVRQMDPVPDNLRQQYRKQSLPLMPLCQILTFDTRVGILFLSLLVGLPWIYPIAEITLFEWLRIYVNRRHEHFSQTLNPQPSL